MFSSCSSFAKRSVVAAVLGLSLAAPIVSAGSSALIETYAGGGAPGDGGLAIEATFENPNDVAFDLEGNMYVSDAGDHRVRRVDTNGVITTIAGNGKEGYSGDGGSALVAKLNSPRGVAADPSGNIYIADSFNFRVRRVQASNGLITTIVEGLFPSAVAVTSSNLYVAGDGYIYEVDIETGAKTPVAGNGEPGYSGDGGLATDASLDSPGGIAFDSSGNLYIADTFNHRIRKVDVSTRKISTVAGNGDWWDSGDEGPATEASLSQPHGVALDGLGNLFISTWNGVRKVDMSTGMISTVATMCGLGVEIDALSDLYIADSCSNRVWKVTFGASPPVITTFAGGADTPFLGDGKQANRAHLMSPTGLAADLLGNVFIADTGHHKVRRVDADGVITTIVGTGVQGFSGDGGPATSAQLSAPMGIAVDGSGALYISDTGNNRIRRVDSSGTITTYAGSVEAGFAGDGGPATAAFLNVPAGIAADNAGNLYVADSQNHRIRKVDPFGIISTVAGNGTPAFLGDFGPATQASLNSPLDVAIDSPRDFLYIADTWNLRIRRVNLASNPPTIETVAGTVPSVGIRVSPIAGLATLAAIEHDAFETLESSEVAVDGTVCTILQWQRDFTDFLGVPLEPFECPDPSLIAFPAGVAVNSAGDVYFSDTGHNSVRKVTPGTLVGTPVMGDYQCDFAGDGTAAGSLCSPSRLAFDATGKLYISDTGNHRVRRLSGLSS